MLGTSALLTAGTQSLETVYASHDSLDPVEVAKELEAVVEDADADVDRLEPVALIAHILTTHHDHLHEELPLLVALAEKVRDVHGTRHDELARVAELANEIRDDLEPHLAKESRCSFPPYEMLYARLEHLESDTHRHVHVENNVLFPAPSPRTQVSLSRRRTPTLDATRDHSSGMASHHWHHQSPPTRIRS